MIVSIGYSRRCSARSKSIAQTKVPMASEAQAEEVSVTNVHEHAVRKNVSAYEALDVLTLKRRFQYGRFH